MASNSGLFTFKVWTCDRKIRKGVLCEDVKELTAKCKEKFMIQGPVRFVSEDDGTEVDDDILPYLHRESSIPVLIILKEEEQWVPREPDHVTKKQESTDDSKMCLFLEKLQKKRQKTHEPTKRKRRMTIGWQHYSYRDKKYIPVRSCSTEPHQGPRDLLFCSDDKYHDILRKAEETFFPKGRSKKGLLKNMETSLSTYSGDAIDPIEFDVMTYNGGSQKPRIYLQSKQKMVTLETESSTSSDDLPDILGERQSRRPSGDRSLFLPSIQTMTTQTSTPTPASTMSNLQSTALFNLSTPTFQAETSAPTLLPDTGIQSGVFVNAGTPTVSFRIDEEQQQQTCPICRERSRHAFLMPCGHTYCTVCAVQLQSNGGLCAVCRAEINRVNNLF